MYTFFLTTYNPENTFTAPPTPSQGILIPPPWCYDMTMPVGIFTKAYFYVMNRLRAVWPSQINLKMIRKEGTASSRSAKTIVKQGVYGRVSVFTIT